MLYTSIYREEEKNILRSSLIVKGKVLFVSTDIYQRKKKGRWRWEATG